MSNLRNRVLTAALALVTLAACADGPLGPTIDGDLAVAEAKGGNGNGNGNGNGQGPSTPDASPSLLQWVTPIDSDIYAGMLCYPNAQCEVKIDEVDAMITIPSGALQWPTWISMTALAGSDVNLRFGPHGTQFQKSVKIKVGQDKTDSHGDQFTAYYWAWDLSNVLDELSATVKQGKIEFETDHFSGYALGM